MSTHAAFKPHIGLPPVRDLVDSLTESASSALASFDARGAQSKQAAPTSQANAAIASTPWITPLSTEPASRFGKSGMFAVVVLVHALAAYVLTHLPPTVKRAVLQPLQVAIVMEQPSEQEQPLPPPPMPSLPNLVLPVEPVFLSFADPDTTSITVETRPTEPTKTSVATGAPKVVSSVEYIREPQPKYPPAARALKQRGTVTLRVLVDAAGHAREVNLHRSSGHRVLDDAARKAVLEAQFKPYMENGHALAVYVFVPIEFGAA